MGHTTDYYCPDCGSELEHRHTGHTTRDEEKREYFYYCVECEDRKNIFPWEEEA